MDRRGFIGAALAALARCWMLIKRGERVGRLAERRLKNVGGADPGLLGQEPDEDDRAEP